MRIVVDTNFLISATQWDYSVSHRLLEKFLKEDIEIFTTEEILEEFEEVLKRDFLYKEEEIDGLKEKILQVINVVVPSVKVDIVKDDADDNKIIECAIESNAEYILSYDKHLLKVKEYKGIKIVKPEEF